MGETVESNQKRAGTFSGLMPGYVCDSVSIFHFILPKKESASSIDSCID